MMLRNDARAYLGSEGAQRSPSVFLGLMIIEALLRIVLITKLTRLGLEVE
jgi:hypothetical protein